MPLPVAKSTALWMAAALLAVTAGCASEAKSQAGLYAQIMNNNVGDATILGCPDMCGVQGVKIVGGGGAYLGWTEPRVAVAYTVIVNGVQSACPPVIPKATYNHGVYFVINAAGRCVLGSRPEGADTPL